MASKKQGLLRWRRKPTIGFKGRVTGEELTKHSLRLPQINSVKAIQKESRLLCIAPHQYYNQTNSESSKYKDSVADESRISKFPFFLLRLGVVFWWHSCLPPARSISPAFFEKRATTKELQVASPDKKTMYFNGRKINSFCPFFYPTIDIILLPLYREIA